MKIASTVLMSILLIACSENSVDVEELAFRKSLEYGLTDKCGKDDACIQAVESQIKGCMEKGKWRQYADNQDDPIETKRFTTEFYACIVDADGNPYFISTK